MAIKHSIRRDSPKVDRDLFRHSLPSTTSYDKQDIIDIILQIILMLLEEFKPEPEPEPGPDDTAFPELADYALTSARRLVDPVTLLETASLLSNAMTRIVEALKINPPGSTRIARETIRKGNHAALGQCARLWEQWNDNVRDNLDDHADAGRLTSIASYLDAWTQIAKGLSRIK